MGLVVLCFLGSLISWRSEEKTTNLSFLKWSLKYVKEKTFTNLPGSTSIAGDSFIMQFTQYF